MTDITPATKLVQAGLVRQAAATSAGTLLASLDGILDDIVRSAPDAMGDSTMGVQAFDSKLTVWGSYDVEALLRGDAGQAVADSIGGAMRLLDEAGAFARVSGDTSLLGTVQRARSELHAAQALVVDWVERAQKIASGERVSGVRAELPGTFHTEVASTVRGGGSLPASETIERIARGAGSRVASARLLADQAGTRIAEFEAIAKVASDARAAAAAVAGTGDVTMQRAWPLVDGAASLLSTVRRTHGEQLPAAFSIRGKELFADLVAIDRHVTSTEHALQEARGLLDELDTLVGTQEAHLLVRQQLTSTRAAAQELAISVTPWRQLRSALSATGAAEGRIVNDGFRLGAKELDYMPRELWTQLREPLGGYSGDVVSRAARKDPAATTRAMAAIPDAAAIDAMTVLRSTISERAAGTAPSSIVGLGTNAAVDDALAAVRGRYGSAADLEAALAASVS